MLRWWRRLQNKARVVHTVYLAGPINKCTDDECKGWRGLAKKLLRHRTKDPMDRDFRGKEEDSVKAIVLGDIHDILKSTVVLVNVERPSWGTAMEIMFAWMVGKIIVGFGAVDRPSPWLIYHCDRLCRTLHEACGYVNLLGGMSEG